MNKVIDMPIKCASCKTEIGDGVIFKKVADIGFVCEFCSDKWDGDIKVVGNED